MPRAKATSGSGKRKTKATEVSSKKKRQEPLAEQEIVSLPERTVGTVAEHEHAVAVPVTSTTGTTDEEAPQILLSAKFKLAANVSQAIQAKIISSAYVDLALLLENTYTNSNAQNTVYINENGQLVTKEAAKPTGKIDNIHKWTDAFIIYSSIYTSVHIQSVQGLYKYMRDVRLGAARNGGLGWKSYDEQFRIRRSLDPSIPWENVDQELWTIFMPTLPSGQNQYNTGPAVHTSINKCHDFNFKGLCIRPICTYSHTCTRCNANHPVLQCKLANSTPYGQGNTQYNHGYGVYPRAAPGANPSTTPSRFRPMQQQANFPSRPRFPAKRFPHPSNFSNSTKYMGFGKNTY
jgi:hypothetical protein